MPSEKQFAERKDNINSILQYLRAHKNVSRRQLCSALSLSWGCVSELVSLLLSKNILIESKSSDNKTMGRAPTLLSLNPDIHFLGIDINNVGLKGCICNFSGEKTLEFSGKLLTESKAAFINSVYKFVSSILKKNSGIYGIGFSMQGIFDSKKNIWEYPSREKIYIDFDKDFKDMFDLPVTVGHDPSCILYGCIDSTLKNNMILRLDKGIGAAVYSGNRLWQNGMMEIGYMIIDKSGKRLHDVVSLNVIENAFKNKKSENEIAQLFNEIGAYLGIAIGNVCNLINLDEIYICGDMVKYFDRFSESLLKEYKKTVLPNQKAEISSVNVMDGAFGAAKIAMDGFRG